MDDWLMEKKLDDARKHAQMREVDHQEDLERQAREAQNYESFAEW